MLAKQGKAGTRGFKATRGAAKICRSTNWEEKWLSNSFGAGEKDKHFSDTNFCSVGSADLNSYLQWKKSQYQYYIRVPSPFDCSFHDYFILVGIMHFDTYNIRQFQIINQNIYNMLNSSVLIKQPKVHASLSYLFFLRINFLSKLFLYPDLS